MRFLSDRRRLFGWVFAFAIATAAFASPRSAWAMKNRTIVLRAAGSGAVLGLGAGLVSYPFAKSTGTIVAGAVLGAVLGTVYGFHLVELKEERVRAQAVTLEEICEANEIRNAVFRRGSSAGGEIAFGIASIEF